MAVEFFYAALFALFTQNLIFNGGFGVSEVIRIAGKPKDFLPIAFLVTVFTSATAAACTALDMIGAVASLNTPMHLLVYCLVLAAIYFLVSAIGKLVVKKENRDNIHRIGLAAVNTLVLCVPIISRRAAFSPAASVGLGVGAGFAFILAVLTVSAGVDRLSENRSIHEDFRGRPALFIYIALISLGLAGLSGSSLFV
jgi:Na+-translocating ferredoxin:NAD+ oxidoreductase RnfA subunit